MSALRTNIVLIGFMGSGKSSILRAGLIPAVQGDGRREWQTHLLTPGAHPLDSLATSLASDPSAASAALLVDDFRRDPRSLRLHINRMLAATPDPRGEMVNVVEEHAGERAGAEAERVSGERTSAPVSQAAGTLHRTDRRGCGRDRKSVV